MRQFHSYGPVDKTKHFAVPRKELVRQCMENLIGDPKQGGHYFTIWASRQTGKTWLMKESIRQIKEIYGDLFEVHQFSLGKLRKAGLNVDGKWGQFELPLPFIKLIQREFPGNPEIQNWDDFWGLFSKNNGLWDKPLILFIDEADTVSPEFLDIMVNQFREMYLDRKSNFLHSLALIGVRAVLGIESERGSPFNIQKSLNVPNLTQEEVEDLFCQYQEESKDVVVPEVIQQVYNATCGQPGLVGWFGELLTTKYNPGIKKSIDIRTWRDVYEAASYKEWNNTVLNLIIKARGPYVNYVLDLFGKANMGFSIHAEWCNYLYLNGIIQEHVIADQSGKKTWVCRFSCPFVQTCVFHALTLDIIGDRLPILAIEPLDSLNDVFEKNEIDIPALLERYKNYLKRLKAKEINPWKDQPRRSDLHITEAVGHFHLYAWLEAAIGSQCLISPEFPTGNGKVDLRIKCSEKTGIIEIKSFIDLARLRQAEIQAAGYGKQTGVNAVTLALFVPVEDEVVLDKLSGVKVIDGVRVAVCAIGWG